MNRELYSQCGPNANLNKVVTLWTKQNSCLSHSPEAARTLMSQSIDMATATAPTTDLIEVSAASLIVGRRIEFPIFDQHDVLLLREGSEITSTILEHLDARGIHTIRMHQDDVCRATINAVQKSGASIQFGSSLTEKLDEIVAGGLVTINTGPAMKDQVCFVGKQAYDREQRTRLLDKHQKNSEALSEMMHDVLTGEAVDGDIITMMAADYLKEMCTDEDNVLTSTIDAFKTDEISARSMDVSILAMALAIELGLDENNVRDIGTIGLVHDWGMMMVPDEIRNAPRRLSPIEFLEIKRHPTYSVEILQRVTALPDVSAIVAYQIHERINGSGYPRGRRGESIHRFSQIIQVADAYVAMTSPRPHRMPYMQYAAIEHLLRETQGTYSSDVLRALVRVQSLFPVGSFVKLSDNSIARVIRANGNHFAKPIVQVVHDEFMSPITDEVIVDLAESELTVFQALPTPGRNERRS